MGLLAEGINEVIATTAFNAAPMGIRYENRKYTLTLFSGSHTAANIERDGWVSSSTLCSMFGPHLKTPDRKHSVKSW